MRKRPILSKNDFSNRELEVLQFLCKGLRTKEIAKKLFLSFKTVEIFKDKLILKTASANTKDLIFYALENQLVDIDSSI